MKKILLTMVCLMIVVPTMAAVNCDETDGIVIYGKDDTPYCKSKVKMNWWSAFTWCQAQNGTLVSLSDCTLNGDTYLTTGKCHNLNGVTDKDGKAYSDTVWTSVAYGSEYAYYVQLSSGSINGNPRHASYNYALCK